jgi:hypothetical protein
MREVILIRISDDGKQTMGALTIKGTDFGCKTLERPYVKNKTNISSIPKGTYNCKWTYSPFLSRFAYEVINVPMRSGIRIHPANYVNELKGCIALGSAYKDINLDGLNDVIHSGDTLRKFEAELKGEDFTLTIL